MDNQVEKDMETGVQPLSPALGQQGIKEGNRKWKLLYYTILYYTLLYYTIGDYIGATVSIHSFILCQ